MAAHKPDYDSTTALLVVDVQNDFADASGSLYVRDGEKAVPYINLAIEEAADAGSLVVYTQDWHPEATPHFAKFGGEWPVHCIADTWGAELQRQLIVAGPSIFKGIGGEDGYSGFTEREPRTGEETLTELLPLLRGKDVEKVVVVGLATDYCVRATALDAVKLGFDTVVLADCIKAVDLDPGDGSRAIADMVAGGVKIA